MVPPDLEPWLRLSLTHGVSDGALRGLLVEHGSPAAVLAASRAALMRTVDADTADALRAGPPAGALDAVAAWLDDDQNHVVTLADAHYPQTLLEIHDPPPLLYVKGRLELLNAPAIAVVGSRNATPQGLSNAETFAQALSDAGFVIVSGLALGIDTAAHRGGLAGKSGSVAHVGTGLDIVYPARNRTLAHTLARDGALVSEFPLGTPPVAANFPRRNRLISGSTRGCVVVEAAISSGSLITARMANEQGRDVFAIPGSIHSPLSKGCHRLIKNGAKLVDSVDDILEELGVAARGANRPANEPVNALLEHMGYDPCDIDMLVERSGEPAAEVSAGLTELELAGRVATLPGGRFQRIR